MPSGDDPVQKSQEFFGVFLKAKEFTEELLKENERLRFKIASLEATAGGGPPTVLDERVRELEQRLMEVETRYRKV
jgi:GAF domain